MAETFERLKTALADRYAIEQELGAGGMATVYLATDLKHERKVAVKVLRPDLAASLGSQRFLREIKIAAQLHHPHILPLHDSGEADGFLYYVMPYQEGHSLREKLEKEVELPVPEAVRLLHDVVDALAHAHKHGVVHRDIKPDNVLLSERHALVTDFGVAKAVSEATGRQELTTAGVALGTPAYMAPEQAVADPHVDHRADIYAIGAMAYELLTGRPPFTGTTAQQILGAHVAEDPRRPSELRPAIPAVLDQFVLTCLEKRPADRYQTADAMLHDLDAALSTTEVMTPTTKRSVATARDSVPVARVAVISGVTVATAILGFLGWTSLRGGSRTMMLSEIRQVTRGPEPEMLPQVAPDGDELVYTSGLGMDTEVFVRDLSGGRPIALTADRPGLQFLPRWMPDGSTIAFAEETGTPRYGKRAAEYGTTYVLPRFGGAATVLLENGYVESVRGEWLAFRTAADSLFARRLENGETVNLNTGEARDIHSVSWSPDAKRLAFVAGNLDFLDPFVPGNVAPSAIWITDRGSGEATPIIDDGRMNLSPVWLPDGRHLLFVSNRDGPRDIYLQRLDRQSRPTGTPRRVSTGLEPHGVSLSQDGRTAVYSRLIFRSNLWSVTLPTTGVVSVRTAEPVLQGNELVENHGVSPDGRWLAFDSDREGNQDLYIMPAAGGEARRITTDQGDDFHPDFGPDGEEILFYSMRHGTRDLFIIGRDGTAEQRLSDGPEEELHPSFSPDGNRLVYLTLGPEGGGISLIARDRRGGAWGEPTRLSEAVNTPPRWSPDGRRVAFASAVTQISTVTPSGDIALVVDGSQHGLYNVQGPEWSADGTTIYFLGFSTSGEQTVYAVAPEGGPIRPVVLLDDPGRAVAFWMTVFGDRLLLTLTEFEADVYTAKIDF